MYVISLDVWIHLSMTVWVFANTPIYKLHIYIQFRHTWQIRVGLHERKSFKWKFPKIGTFPCMYTISSLTTPSATICPEKSEMYGVCFCIELHYIGQVIPDAFLCQPLVLGSCSSIVGVHSSMCLSYASACSNSSWPLNKMAHIPVGWSWHWSRLSIHLSLGGWENRD